MSSVPTVAFQLKPDFQKLIEYSLDHIALLDVTGQILYANSIEHLLGYNLAAYVGLRFQTLLSPDSLLTARQMMSDLIASPALTQVRELQLQHRAGHYVWVEVTARNLLQAPEISAIMLTCHDISLHKQTEAELAAQTMREAELATELSRHTQELEQHITKAAMTQEALSYSEIRYRSVVEDQTDLICRYDVDFNLTFVNQAYAEIFGTTPDELLGKCFLDLIPPDQRDYAITYVRSLTPENPVAISEHQAIMPDHTLRWTQWTDRALLDDWGNIIEYQGVGRDITEQKLAQQALEDYQNQLEQRVEQRTNEVNLARARVEAILNNSTDGIVLAYPDIGIEQSNLTFDKLFDCTRDAYFGQPLHMLVQPEDRERLDILVHAVLTDQIGRREEFQAMRHDGSVFASQIGIGFIRSGAVEGDGLVCTIHDITELKERELQLRYHASLQENVTDAVIATDMGYVIRSWNRAAETIYGWTAAEALGQPIVKLLSSRTTPDERLRQLIQLNEQGSWHGEVTQTRKDGRLVDILGSVNLLRDAYGTAIGVVAVNHDITERKRQEYALRKSEESFRQLVESAPVPIIISDGHGLITLINRQAEVLFGYNRDELIGQFVEILIPEEMREQHVDYRHDYQGSPYKRGMGTGRKSTLNLSARRKDGSSLPVDIQLSYIQTDVGLLVMSFVIDITEHKQIEKTLREAFEHERELNELKSRFVSMASHEFRTPLATILAAAETLGAYRAKMTDEQIDHRLVRIHEQVFHLRQIIEDVLQLSRIQAGKVEFNPVSMSLDSLCQEIIDELHSDPASAARLIYAAEPHLPMLTLDKKLMRQIITNLIGNALKYSAADKLVYIKLGLQENRLALSVRDQGIGIPEVDLKHLFEPFHRAANVGTIPGTGLGLAIANESVELHGGKIVVDSKIGLGTTFTIYLPASNKS